MSAALAVRSVVLLASVEDFAGVGIVSTLVGLAIYGYSWNRRWKSRQCSHRNDDDDETDDGDDGGGGGDGDGDDDDDDGDDDEIKGRSAGSS